MHLTDRSRGNASVDDAKTCSDARKGRPSSSHPAHFSKTTPTSSKKSPPESADSPPASDAGFFQRASPIRAQYPPSDDPGGSPPPSGACPHDPSPPTTAPSPSAQFPRRFSPL